ncbi:MAG TPA: Fe-S cluster assembly protein SufD [Burkholderiales bacterium]|nr:Fe-S cluster assembly protein SufD [Burkholderiales bacterium]
MTTAVHPYIDSLLSGTRDLPRAPEAWLNDRRGAALERANALAVPTTREEEWRFTDLAPLTRLTWKAPGGRAALTADAIASYVVPEAGARLVFVDGVYAPALSHTDGCTGVVVAALAEALKRGVALEPHLARHADFERNVFVALNTAHLKEAAVVQIGKDAACDKPVHVLHLATEAGTAAYPRCAIVAERGAQCTVIEEYQALTADAYFNNSVTEVVVAPNANLRHVKLQLEGAKAFHIAACAVKLARDASYTSQTISVGARLSRYELGVHLGGEGGFAQVDGLALIGTRQLADTHTTLDHAHPNCRSVQLHKTIVGGAAHAVFNGKICVRAGAQQTDSAQESRNLLLSDKATVDTKPQLEIFADDVKCAHGATVGQLDADQLFYLRSRGLPEQAARNLLTYAFGASVIERIPVPSLVQRLEKLVMAQTGAAA